jgi:hypothetical protein
VSHIVSSAPRGRFSRRTPPLTRSHPLTSAIIAEVVTIADSKIKQEDIDYLQEHEIGKTLNYLMHRILKEKPLMPVTFLIEEIEKLKDQKFS